MGGYVGGLSEFGFEVDAPSNTNLKSYYIDFYYKKIAEEDIKLGKFDKRTKVQELINIVDSLMPSSHGKFLYELKMSINCVTWINDILFNTCSNRQDCIHYLLNDFAGKMNTRMREEDKFAIAIVCEKAIILCHSNMGDKTVTTSLNIAERMLDKDNVMRFVCFKKSDENIIVKFYETTHSRFFVDWLGIPEKDVVYYLGGKNRFHFEIESLPCVIELSDTDFQNKILCSAIDFKIKENCIVLPNPISRIQISQIQSDKLFFDNTEDFLQAFKMRQYGFTAFQKRYTDLRFNFKNTLETLCSTCTYIDNESGVVKNEFIGDNSSKVNSVTVVTKDPSCDVNIIFATKLKDMIIDIKPSYFSKLYSDFINNKPLKIFHAGMGIIVDNPIRIRNLEIYNSVKMNAVIDKILSYYGQGKMTDAMMDKAVLCTIFILFSEANKDTPIFYLLDLFAKYLGNDVKKSNVLFEDEYKIIEYKSRDVFSGTDMDIVDYISKDLIKKSSNILKIYVFGVEDSRTIDPIPLHRFDSGRIGNIQGKLREQFRGELTLIQIPLNDNKNCIFLLVALNNMPDKASININLLEMPSETI
jgi:hypothetical protein